MICNVEKKDYAELIDIWEASARATHDFLPEEEIAKLKPLILEKYFDALSLKCFKNSQGAIIGFFGVSDQKMEMIFVSPNAQGQGIGSKLCQYAIKHHSVTKIDVNEQNPRAITFYKKIGFKITGHSELDGQGNPYPIFHMELIF